MSPISDENQQQRPRARFPPVINSIDFLGEIKEDDFLRYSRNVGCSSLLGGSPLFLFGDTFAFHPPPHSQFIRIASSTASLSSVSDPLFTRYPSCSTGIEGKAGFSIPQFIPFTKDEDRHNLSRGGDMGKANDRFYLWTFNSVIEIPGQYGKGVVWFIKGKTNDHRQENDSYYGIGVAEVEMKQIDVTGTGLWQKIPVAKRRGDIIFDSSSPQWGNVATLLAGDFIYLYGTYHQHHPRRRRDLRRKAGNTVVGFVENPVYVCRVPHANKSYLFLENYTYWNGEAFVGAPTSVRPSRYKGPCHTKAFNLEPVMYNIQFGTVFHTKLFSCTEEGLFAVIGCDGSGDGKVRFKIAENPWGPWRGEGWILDLETEDRGNRGAKSCIYAHIWASDLGKGEMVLTWSEPWPGGVEMVKIGFEMVHGNEDEEEYEQSIESDKDSIYSCAEGQLFRETGWQQSREVEILDDDEYIELTEDEKERHKARSHTLAKLSGETTIDDNRSFMLGFNEYQDQLRSSLPKTASLFSSDPFSEDPPNSDLFGERAKNPFVQLEEVDSDETAADRGTKESEDDGGDQEVGMRGMRRLTDSQTYDSADTETRFSTAGTLVRRSLFYPQNMHPATIEGISENEGDAVNNSARGELILTGERWRGLKAAVPPIAKANQSPLLTPLHTPAYAQHNRASTDAFSLISIDDPLADPIGITDFRDFVNSSAISLISIDDPRADLIGVSMDPQQPQQEKHEQQDHQPGYWLPRNGGVGPLVTEPDEEMGMRILVPGGRSGYEGGGYVTAIENTRELHSSTNTLEGSWHGSTEKPESSSSKSKKQWPIGKVLKGGVQKLLGRKETKEEGGGKLQVKAHKGLAKKLSEMNLKMAGRSVVNLRKLGKSEVHLQNPTEDSFSEF